MARATAKFGALTLVMGPDDFLADRAIAEAVAHLRQLDRDTALTTVDADDLDLGRLQEVTGVDLFAASAIAVIREVEKLPSELAAPLLALAAAPPAEIALIIHHGGGNAGKAVLDKLKPLAHQTVSCATIKPWKLAEFVVAEARTAGGTIDLAGAQYLVDAVGTQTRALAAAVSQLLADSEQPIITPAQIQRYFASRATVTSYAVADDALAGRTGAAMVKLRWALATGTAPVMVTAAFAQKLRQLGRYLAAARGLRQDSAIAEAIGVEAWRVKTIREQSRGWTDQAVGRSLRAVAKADAGVKGAAGDAAFALEQMVLTVSRGSQALP